MSNVLVIDNYDSFTWNLVHLIGPLCDRIDVVRNDRIDVAGIRARAPDALVLSPGRARRMRRGSASTWCGNSARRCRSSACASGSRPSGRPMAATWVRAPAPMHGKVSTIRHAAKGVFRGLNEEFDATRYHSLVVDRASCPDDLTVTAEADGLIMGLQHRTLPVHGVQFHPESILSNHGTQIMRNFLDLAAAWRAQAKPRA